MVEFKDIDEPDKPQEPELPLRICDDEGKEDERQPEHNLEEQKRSLGNTHCVKVTEEKLENGIDVIKPSNIFLQPMRNKEWDGYIKNSFKFLGDHDGSWGDTTLLWVHR